MDSKILKKLKVIYYPCRAIKRVLWEMANYFQYSNSLNYIKKNKKRVQFKIDNKEILNVVFVIQYVPGWNKLSPIYDKMKQDSRFNPVIICVPLNIKNHKLTSNDGNDTYKYFKDHGYEAIDALKEDGNWYDLKQLEPDYVFHSRPYNHFMPKLYTSNNIVKYALICNVIYGPCMTINGLETTLNKTYFRDAFVYFAFDTCERDYYNNRFKLGINKLIQKCFPYGSIGIEQILAAKADRKENGFRKTVLWTPRWSTDLYIGGSNFFNYKNLMTSLAKENQDILFIFRPHPLMFENFARTGEMSQEEIYNFKQYCEREKNIILDESKEYSDKFWNSDILITDASAIVSEYFITEKPVMYCNTNALFKYVEYAKDMINSCYEVNNDKDLVAYFLNLINDNDFKLDDRLAFIKKHFRDASKNSANIISFLRDGRL